MVRIPEQYQKCKQTRAKLAAFWWVQGWDSIRRELAYAAQNPLNVARTPFFCCAKLFGARIATIRQAQGGGGDLGTYILTVHSNLGIGTVAQGNVKYSTVLK